MRDFLFADTRRFPRLSEPRAEPTPFYEWHRAAPRPLMHCGICRRALWNEGSVQNEVRFHMKGFSISETEAYRRVNDLTF